MEPNVPSPRRVGVRDTHGGGGGRRVEQARVRRLHHLPTAQHRRPERPGRRRGRNMDITGGNERPAVGPVVDVDQPDHRVRLEVAVSSVQHPAVDCAAPPYRQSDEGPSGAGRSAHRAAHRRRQSSARRPAAAAPPTPPPRGATACPPPPPSSPGAAGPRGCGRGCTESLSAQKMPEDVQRAGDPHLRCDAGMTSVPPRARPAAWR